MTDWYKYALVNTLQLRYEFLAYTVYNLVNRQCIQYKLSVLMYRCLNGAAPRYLTELATPVGSTVRRRLRSASSRAWNSLPPAVRSSATYNIFKKTLNLTFLDYHSHCDNVFWLCTSALIVVLYKLFYWHYITWVVPSLITPPHPFPIIERELYWAGFNISFYCDKMF